MNTVEYATIRDLILKQVTATNEVKAELEFIRKQMAQLNKIQQEALDLAKKKTP